MFADPLSRVCGPTEGWYDPSLPRKLAALFEHLPNEVRNNINIRVHAGKDTYAAGRLVQKWRKPKDLDEYEISGATNMRLSHWRLSP